MILVPIDMPKFCGECYFCTQYHETYPLICRLTKDTVDEDDKPENCPLIEAPNRGEESVTDSRGLNASFRTIHMLQDIYEYVSGEQEMVNEGSELIKSLCSRGCEHIHRLRYCNYD